MRRICRRTRTKPVASVRSKRCPLSKEATAHASVRQSMHSAAGTVTRFRESAAMIKLLPGLPDNVVGVVASGELTGRDYEQVKMAVNSAVQTVGRVRLLIQMAP